MRIKKHTHTHHGAQFLHIPWLKDHHIFFVAVVCIVSIVMVAGVVRMWKDRRSALVENIPVFVTEDVESSVEKEEVKKKKKEKKVIPQNIPRLLDGVVVDRAEYNPIPLCVMIENLAYEGVRPQYGLSQASIVYEVIVEGGITRFMAIFPSVGRIDMIGPVRSARDTFLEFASEYNCPYAHAGGSYTALQAIRNMKILDLDGLWQPKYFWRDRSRYAPHNFFTSLDNLRTAVNDWGWNHMIPSFDSWHFVDEESAEVRAASTDSVARTIRIDYGDGYDVDYTYDDAQNAYMRKNANVAHIDAGTKSQLAPKNVIIEHVGAGTLIEGKGRINWPVTGEGAVEIFHDGHVYTGKWIKKDRLSRTTYVDAVGKEIPLARGQTWIEIVPPHITSSYQ